jgi:hypothetical protein
MHERRKPHDHVGPVDLGVGHSIIEATLDALASACEARLMVLDQAALGAAGHA